MRIILSLAVQFGVALAAVGAAVPETDPAAVQDKSGTNPLNFQNTFALKNEFSRLGDNYASFTKVTSSQPLAPNVKVGLELPLLATDLTGQDKSGLSDISIKCTWILAARRGRRPGADRD